MRDVFLLYRMGVLGSPCENYFLCFGFGGVPTLDLFISLCSERFGYSSSQMRLSFFKSSDLLMWIWCVIY